MTFPKFHYRWEWSLGASPEALWPYVSDTNRFNRDTGVPSVTAASDAEAPDRLERRLSLVKYGVAIEWEEEPFEWVRPYHFGVVRRYQRGPVAKLTVQVELNPLPTGGTKLIYQVRAQPKTLLGLIGIPVQIGVLQARRFEGVIRRYDRLARFGQSAKVPSSASVELTAGGRQRLLALQQTLLAEGADRTLVTQLAATIERGDDLAVARLRPYALADTWGVPRRDVLVLCLWATRAGLLNFRWELLCPLCRGAKDVTRSLSDLDTRVHCESCNIDVTGNLDRLVELTFQPNPAIREIDVGEFCVGGPQVTPHIVAQQILPSGAQRAVQVPLEAGSYRLRVRNIPGGRLLRVGDDGLAAANISPAKDGWPDDELRLSARPTLNLTNPTDSEQLFTLERTAWSDQAATAADVTSLQLFRDLFASEVLRIGQQLSVGSLTVVFTDLRGSTRLYRRIGDAAAFSHVMNHFTVLREAIAEEDGVLIKTIGDAVMASFRRPVAAVRAMLHAQRRLASPPDGVPPLYLKAGVHAGPSIAVTLNDRLDYFGSTVNLAARLEGLSSGEDIIVSGAVFADPEVTAFLSSADEGLSAERFENALKGFDEEQFALWRVNRPVAVKPLVPRN